MTETADILIMKRALSLAGRAKGKTSPNPMVGAVIVKNGRVISEGYHRKAGTDHAEIVALKKAGNRAKNATLYVTLEPCCHTGRTGPCSEAIIRAGIKRVVYAMKDPDPRVNGRGAARLRQAGLEVTANVLRHETRRLNEQYVGHIENGRPFVILKTAQTIDGRIATTTGDSQWVSGPQSLKFAHRLRAEVDAVAVGTGTVIADNPSLTVRHVKGGNPYRIILTGSMKFPNRCKLLENNSDFKTIVASTADAIDRFARRRKTGNLIYWDIKSRRNGLLDLNDFLVKTDRFGLRSVLVEGGGRLATSLLKEGLVDKYIAIIAPKLIGEGINAVGDLRKKKLADAITFGEQSFTRCGDDMIFVGYPERKR